MLTIARRRYLLYVLITLYLLWGTIYIYRTSFTVSGTRVFSLWDDAMISMRYARNLAAGHGLVWNPGEERVQGFTNLGITLIMAGLHLLPVSIHKVSALFQIFNLLLIAAVIWITYEFCRLRFPKNSLLPIIAATFTAIYAPLSVWSLQGSDVGLLTFLLFLSLWLLIRHEQNEKKSSLVVYLPLALGIIVRPDFSVVYLAFLVFFLLDENDRTRHLWFGSFIFFLVWIGLLFFNSLYYHDLLPNTYYMKATGQPLKLQLQAGIGQTATLLGRFSPLMIIFTLVNLYLFLRKEKIVYLLLLIIIPVFAYNVWIGGDWIYSYPSRFVVPVIPLFIILFLAGCTPMVEKLVEGSSHSERSGAILFVLLATAGFWHMNYPRNEWLSVSRKTFLGSINEQNYRYGIYLRDRTDPKTTVAYHWAGVAPYFSDRIAIDVLGKSDRHIAKLKVDRFIPGHSKWDWNYIVNVKRPNILLGMSRGLDQRKDFIENYLKVQTKDGLEFFLRKDSLSLLLDHQVQFSKITPSASE